MAETCGLVVWVSSSAVPILSSLSRRVSGLDVVKPAATARPGTDARAESPPAAPGTKTKQVSEEVAENLQFLAQRGSGRDSPLRDIELHLALINGHRCEALRQRRWPGHISCQRALQRAAARYASAVALSSRGVVRKSGVALACRREREPSKTAGVGLIGRCLAKSAGSQSTSAFGILWVSGERAGTVRLPVAIISQSGFCPETI